MIPPTTNELKQHSNDLSDFGKNLHNLNGLGKASAKVALVAIALISISVFILPLAAEIA